jgi:hypothetical protein
MGMRPVTVTTTDASGGAKVSDPVPMNWRSNPQAIGLQLDVTGTVVASVQYTLDDIRRAGWTAASANWSTFTNWSAVAADQGGNVEQPCTAIRLNQASGAGSCSLRIVPSTQH